MNLRIQLIKNQHAILINVQSQTADAEDVMKEVSYSKFDSILYSPAKLNKMSRWLQCQSWKKITDYGMEQ